MARAGASKTMTQQEAGRLLSKKVKKHFDEFDREHRRKVAKQLRKIGERLRTYVLEKNIPYSPPKHQTNIPKPSQNYSQITPKSSKKS